MPGILPPVPVKKRKRSPCLQSNSPGFTLLELMVVLVLLGLALAVVAPDLRKSLDNLRYRVAARELAATLRYARSQAVNTKITQEVTIDAEDGSYTLSPKEVKANTKEGDNGEMKGDGEALTVEGLKKKLPPGLTVEEGEDSGRRSKGEGQLVVSFFPKGNSSGAGILLKGGDSRYWLEVDEITGRVKVSSVER